MASPTLTPTGIRIDLVDRLKGRTSAGDQVFDSRQVNVDEDELPVVTVYSAGNREEKVATNTPVYRHTEQVGLSCIVTGGDDAELAAAVDDIEAEILDALNGDLEWLGSFERLSQVTAKKRLNIEANRRVGGVSLQFEVQYTVRYRPSTSGLELRRVAVTTDSSAPAGADVSERVLEVGA